MKLFFEATLEVTQIVLTEFFKIVAMGVCWVLLLFPAWLPVLMVYLSQQSPQYNL